MIIRLDAHLSPSIASWITREFYVPAVTERDLGLRHAKDRKIISAASYFCSSRNCTERLTMSGVFARSISHAAALRIRSLSLWPVAPELYEQLKT
jgi:hypothetical protein